MIFGLLGTSELSFSRLADSLDKYSKESGQRVVVQVGHTTSQLQYCESFDFLPRNEILRLINESSVVVCQGGFGSMFDAIKAKKRVIAVPRQISLNETAAEQDSLIDLYESRGLVIKCSDVSNLNEMIDTAINNNHCQNVDFFDQSIPTISNILEDILKDG